MKIKEKKILSIAVIASIVLFTFSHLQANDDIVRAMRDEINRSMNHLYLESLEKPYYIEYTLKVTDAYRIGATLGSIINSTHRKRAELTVSVRVGSYKFDNSNFFDIGLSFFGSSDNEESFKNRTVPYELDYNTLNRELWLATDAAYKQAAEVYSKKIAAIKNKVRLDTTPDFSQLPPEKNYDTTQIPPFPVNKFENLCRSVSSTFVSYKNLQLSHVVMEYTPETVYYVNSEGREYIKTDLYAGFELVAATQADDGMPLTDTYSAYSKSPYDLPREDSLLRAAVSISVNLTKLEKASVLDDAYSGPIIFEGQAADELFAQVFAPDLVTQRIPLSEGGMQDAGKYFAFQTKIGGRVLPEFLTVKAEPEKLNFEHTPLLGSYKIDDDGVIAKDETLVKDGYLKNLLSSRIPIKRVHQTNGHKRGGAAMLSVISLTTDKSHSKSENELVNQMLKLCKDRELPYGIIVKKILNQNILYTTLQRIAPNYSPISYDQQSIPLIEAYKVYSNGKKELIRGSLTNGFTVQSFKDILNVGDKPYVMNYLAPSISSPYFTGGDLYIGSTVIVPSLLFEDGEIKSSDENYPNKPFIQNPLSIDATK
jgi:predicted Zn-dependent protease